MVIRIESSSTSGTKTITKTKHLVADWTGRRKCGDRQSAFSFPTTGVCHDEESTRFCPVASI